MFKPFGIFLLSLFLFSQVYNTAVWVNYELNTAKITEEFCENTDKPELNCHGTCHLKKQIISTDNQNPVESNTQLYINEIQLFSSSSEQNSFKTTVNQVINTSFIDNNYAYLSNKSLLQPPQA
ncbi:MAG: hypothetical protein ACI9GM_000504 [Salibacteraceae bacterium]|jgi:hypothetical protein